MKRQNISSNTKWEPVVGYARAVRIGQTIYVSGTTATDDKGEVVGIGDPYRQTVKIIENIERALKKADAELSDVVRTRIYVTDMSDWKEVGSAHGKYFGSILPATSMVEVSRLIDADMLVEIEAVAVIKE
ncbi:RidA family protein [Balneolaceae bacterium YR4-1]|uniref:RidA family protein n=1 Tax=Halalkalibaculum roseum TaxID=2709311 RepID=A0A6M1SXI5_9BACT|nr:RidA family protein [Halalkalibaculum roseum]NGP76978.1 RidA family protein [Halalkalibaculum roseum]